MAEEDLEQTIIDAATGPAKVTVDGQTVEQPALGDLIQADKHLTNKRAAKRPGLGGLKFVKIVPPGGRSTSSGYNTYRATTRAILLFTDSFDLQESRAE